jgi:hypothetical protein
VLAAILFDSELIVDPAERPIESYTARIVPEEIAGAADRERRVALLKGLGSLLPIGALAGGAALLGKGGILGAAGPGLLGYGAGALAGPLLQSAAASLFLNGSIGTGLATALDTCTPASTC